MKVNGFCNRCKERWAPGLAGRCANCGCGPDTKVRKKRRRNIGGKRGRNSGTTSASKAKR